MTREQVPASSKPAHSEPRSAWAGLLVKFAVLAAAFLVIRLGLGALAGNPQVSVDTIVWALAVAAAIVALDVFRNRMRSR